MSNSVHAKLKTREISPYRTYSASTWVSEQLPAPLDSARFGIGQLAAGSARAGRGRWRDRVANGDADGGVVDPGVGQSGRLTRRRCCELGAGGSGTIPQRRGLEPHPRRVQRTGGWHRERIEVPGRGIFTGHHMSDLMRQARQRARRRRCRGRSPWGRGTGRGLGSATKCPHLRLFGSDRVGALAITFG